MLEKTSAKIFLTYILSGLNRSFHGRPFLLVEPVQKSNPHPTQSSQLRFQANSVTML